MDVDLTHPLHASPFWSLVRYGWTEDITAEEREEAAAADVTDFDDTDDFEGFSLGLSYNRIEDATAVAQRMANRFGEPFGVEGSHDASASATQWFSPSTTELR